MTKQRTIGWWCRHLGVLLLAGVVLQFFVWVVWLIWQEMDTAAAVAADSNQRGHHIYATTMAYLICGTIIVLCYWWGHCLIKKMMNKT